MLMTKPRSNPSTPVRVRSPHSMTMTASPGSSMRLATSFLDTPGNTRSGPGGASRLTRRTSLPICHRAYAIASCEPMASPSGRTCDDSTKRCRLRISSATRARADTSVVAVIVTGSGIRNPGSAVGGTLCVLLVNVAKDLLDAVLIRDRFVEPELQLRHAAQVGQSRADLPPEEAGRARQRPRRFLARLLIAKAGVENAGQLQIPGDRHACQRDESDARIVHLAAAEDVAQLLANLIAYAIWTIALRHGITRSLPSRAPW